MSHPSLYAAIRIARLVEKVKNCLKSRIKKYIVHTKPPRSISHIMLDTDTRKRVRRWSTISSTSASNLPPSQSCSSRQSRRQSAKAMELLNDLDRCRPGDLSLRSVAADDSLLLAHNFHLKRKNLQQTYDIVDLTTALLARLQGDSVGDGHNVALWGDFRCAKFVANLEHLLRCLQQIALDAIASHICDMVEAHILRWHSHWQQVECLGEGWFAEWPNSHRPLNTTWPWNVKTCLLVLWGVCWMFYGQSSNPTSNPRETRNRRGAAQVVVSGDFRTGQIGSLSQPTPQAPQAVPSDAWRPSNTYPNYSWLHPQQAGVRASRANATPSQSVLPSYQSSLAANPYITTTSNESSDLFATSSIQWPYCQGINQDPPPAYDQSYAPWQPPYSTHNTITGSLTTTPPSIDPQTPSQSYASLRQGTYPQAAVADVGSLGFGLGLHMQGMQDYPSPHSNVSEQTTSSCLSVLPGAMMSPSRAMVASPSIVPSLEGSTNSRHSSRRSTEPPRNAQGVFYCSHRDCADRPPVFSRKCEWTKHMDKHNRPYVCEEPECDNIRGFTYSGGLLRHQREVHRQHGGPKASCMCPYKDCKRSTGIGFSRKENLNEHLRRCHQPRRQSQAQSQSQSQAQSQGTGIEDAPSSSRPKKRRRGADENDEEQKIEDEADEGNLQREVKKLRRELAEKDERLKRLEKMMESLTRGPQGGASR